MKIPLFPETELSLIHVDWEKSWRITEFINNYHNPNYHLEIELACLEDDIYTFHSSNNKFSVNLGEDRCFGTNDDGIFTADIEIFDGELIFMEASQGKTIYLRLIIYFFTRLEKIRKCFKKDMTKRCTKKSTINISTFFLWCIYIFTLRTKYFNSWFS